MNFFIRNSKSGRADATLTLAVYGGFAAVIRFLFDGVTLTIGGNVFAFGSVDAMAYTALLAPILAAHGYIHTTGKTKETKNEQET